MFGMLYSWLVCCAGFHNVFNSVGLCCFLDRCLQRLYPTFSDNLEGLSGVHTAAWPDGLCPHREGRTQKDRCQEAVQASEHCSSLPNGAVSDLSMDMLLESGLIWATFEWWQYSVCDSVFWMNQTFSVVDTVGFLRQVFVFLSNQGAFCTRGLWFCGADYL